MLEIVNVTLTVSIQVELDEGDFFDPEEMESETRAFLSRYGPIETFAIEHDAIEEGDEED